MSGDGTAMVRTMADAELDHFAEWTLKLALAGLLVVGASVLVPWTITTSTGIAVSDFYCLVWLDSARCPIRRSRHDRGRRGCCRCGRRLHVLSESARAA